MIIEKFVIYYIYDYFEEVVESMAENIREEVFHDTLLFSKEKIFRFSEPDIFLEKTRSMEEICELIKKRSALMGADVMAEISKIYSPRTLYYYLIIVKKKILKWESKMGAVIIGQGMRLLI